jgi:hypothetical protein
MAVFTRTNGNAQLVVSVGNVVSVSTEAASAGQIIATGIGKPIICKSFTANATMATQMGTNEAVEILLRWIGGTNTVIAYQVNTTQLSVMMEDGDVAGLDQTNANANLSAGGYGNLVISSIADTGFKLATS